MHNESSSGDEKSQDNYQDRYQEEAYRKSVKEIFESIDKDGDGFIGVNELMNYLTVIGCKPTKEEVIKMVEDADKNNKGCLSTLLSE